MNSGTRLWSDRPTGLPGSLPRSCWSPADVFLCLPAHYVEWHLERAWAPFLLGDEEQPDFGDPVVSSQRSAPGLMNPSRAAPGTGRSRTVVVLAEPSTLTSKLVGSEAAPEKAAFEITSTPTPLQARGRALLNPTPASV